jgi:hypothetical protein
MYIYYAFVQGIIIFSLSNLWSSTAYNYFKSLPFLPSNEPMFVEIPLFGLLCIFIILLYLMLTHTFVYVIHMHISSLLPEFYEHFILQDIFQIKLFILQKKSHKKISTHM